MPRIPALTMSGGKLSEFGGIKAAKEFRIWVHPLQGDDYYYAFKTYNQAKRAYDKAKNATKAQLRKNGVSGFEQILAVVADPKWRKGMSVYKRYREVVVDRNSFKVPKPARKGGG